MTFDHFVGVDWSGAKGRSQKGIAVAEVGAVGPVQLVPPLSGAGRWSRLMVLDLIRHLSARAGRTLLGIDSGFALPFMDEATFLPGGPDWPTAKALWRAVNKACEASEHLECAGFIEAYPDWFHLPGRPRAARALYRMRETEKRFNAQYKGRVETMFKLIGPNQVGRSGLTTMRMLDQLEQDTDIAVWPFDDVANAKVVIVELYSGLFLRAQNILTKIRDRSALDNALGALDATADPAGLSPLTDHAADALIMAAGLRLAAHKRDYWHPQDVCPKVLATEGWIFGVE